MSHIRIKNEYFRTPEFIEFNKRVKSTVYFFLLSAIIRESAAVKNPHHGAHYIYKTHYLKGELVSRYSQEKIKYYLKTSQSRVSNFIDELVQDGLIKVTKIPTKIGNISYYQFGTWTGKIGTESYKETLWFDTIFTKLYEARQKEKAQQRKEKGEQGMLELFGGDREAFEYYMKMEFG